jgi:predicted metal-binding membrane protein
VKKMIIDALVSVSWSMMAWIALAMAAEESRGCLMEESIKESPGCSLPGLQVALIIKVTSKGPFP